MAQNIAIQDGNQIEALMLAEGWAGFRAYFDDVKVFELTNSKATLNVTVFDESGFMTASANSFTKLAEVKVKIFDGNGNLVASGQSEDDGTVAFSARGRMKQAGSNELSTSSLETSNRQNSWIEDDGWDYTSS